MFSLFSFMAISADGYHADLQRGLGWQTFGEEFTADSVEQLDEVDTLVLGRRTFEELSAYWTSASGRAFDEGVAARMNDRAKWVVTDHPEGLDWPGSETRAMSLDQLRALRGSGDGRGAVLGSSTLTATLLRAGLVDELRLMVHPVLLGRGLPVFEHQAAVSLELTRVRPFESGPVLLYYRPAA